MVKLIFIIVATVCLFINTNSLQFYFNCDDKPCQHGECVDLYQNTAYRCDCESGWEGENCEKCKRYL